MDGRLSMEKAKAIRAKRDLAKELGKLFFQLVVLTAQAIRQRMSNLLSKPLLGNPLETNPKQNQTIENKEQIPCLEMATGMIAQATLQMTCQQSTK